MSHKAVQRRQQSEPQRRRQRRTNDGSFCPSSRPGVTFRRRLAAVLATRHMVAPGRSPGDPERPSGLRATGITGTIGGLVVRAPGNVLGLERRRRRSCRSTGQCHTSRQQDGCQDLPAQSV